MANRPGSLCVLRTGKSLGAQKDFAATFNWLVACVKNIRGGKGVKVSWPADDTPEITLDGAKKKPAGGADGGGGGGSCGGFAYDPETGSISSGCVIVGRTPILVQGVSGVSTGKWRVKVTIGQSSTTAEIEQGDGFTAPTESVSYIPLYDISETTTSDSSGNAVTDTSVTDYRGAITVQCWE